MRTFTSHLTCLCALASAVGAKVEAAELDDRNCKQVDDREIFDELAGIADASVGAVGEQTAAQLLRRYIAVLRDGDEPDLGRLERLANLPVLQLPRPSDGPYGYARHFAGDEDRELALAVIDLLGEILDQCSGRRDAQRQQQEKLVNRLRAKLLQFDAYQDAEVLERAALQYRRHCLDSDGSADLFSYVGFLRSLPMRNQVASRVVRDSYYCIDQDLETRLRGLARQSPAARERILVALRALRGLLADHLDFDRPGVTGISACDREVFREWERQALSSTLGPGLRGVLSLKTSPQERLELGLALAAGVNAEDGLDHVLARIHRFGLTPESAITALPRPTPAKPQPYGLGPCSTIMIDVYRAALGDATVGDAYAVPSAQHASLAESRETFRRNCASVLLACLQGLAANRDETVGACIGELMLLVAQGMKEEVARLSVVPDMDEWGERAALFLSVGDGSAVGEQRWLDARTQFLGQLLKDGVPQGAAAANGAAEQGRGVFAQFEQRLPDALADRMQITNPERRAHLLGSPLLKDTLRDGRRRFAEAFIAASQSIRNPGNILRQWGMPEYADDLVPARWSRNVQR